MKTPSDQERQDWEEIKSTMRRQVVHNRLTRSFEGGEIVRWEHRGLYMVLAPSSPHQSSENPHINTLLGHKFTHVDNISMVRITNGVNTWTVKPERLKLVTFQEINQ